MCGRPILAALQPEFEMSKDSAPLLNEPAKPRPEENDRSAMNELLLSRSHEKLAFSFKWTIVYRNYYPQN